MRGILDRVPGLVGRDPHRRERPAGVNVPRQAQHLAARVVVIAQLAGDRLDGDARDAARLHDHRGGLGPAQPRRRRNPRPLAYALEIRACAHIDSSVPGIANRK